jgi:hypothetical protein
MGRGDVEIAVTQKLFARFVGPVLGACPGVFDAV